MEKIIKIVLAVLLFTCLLDMPYGYFQLVRFIAMVGFAILAFSASQKKDQTELIVCVVLAVLFQPLLKISLGRTIWNIVDVVVAIGLLLNLSTTFNKNRK
jgi:O-antigen ligase